MVEIINAYNIDGHIIRTEERKKLLKEQQEESLRLGKPTFSVSAVFGLYKNSLNQLYVQLRGDKDENPFLLDKTVGGHIVAGQTPDQSIVKESQEELGALVQIVSPEEYSIALKNYDTQKMAIIRKLDYIPNLESNRKNRDGSSWLKKFNITLYGGIYNGPVNFVDGEVEGIHLFPAEQVLSMMKNNPEKFTFDLAYLLKNYKDKI